MKTPSNKPPPFKNGVFAFIFYLHFNTAQNRYNMYTPLYAYPSSTHIVDT